MDCDEKCELHLGDTSTMSSEQAAFVLTNEIWYSGWSLHWMDETPAVTTPPTLLPSWQCENRMQRLAIQPPEFVSCGGWQVLIVSRKIDKSGTIHVCFSFFFFSFFTHFLKKSLRSDVAHFVWTNAHTNKIYIFFSKARLNLQLWKSLRSDTRNSSRRPTMLFQFFVAHNTVWVSVD